MQRKQMTMAFRDANCYCQSLCEDSSRDCDYCETYQDDHIEEHEERKRAQMQLQQEY